MSKLPFSIENIAPHLFPEKKKKKIQAWQDMIREQTGAGKKGNRTNKKLDPKEFESEHWTCFSAAQAATGQYTGYRILGCFQLKNMLNAEYPENELKKLFKMVFQRALKGAEENGIKADQFLVGISSPVLDWDVRGRYHRIDNNTIESLFHRFEIIDQSNQRKDDGRDSITAAPFTVDITAIKTKGRKRKHAGGCGKRRVRPFFHNININALIEVNNIDNFCLFRAVELSRAKATLEALEYRNYKISDRKQQHDLTNLFSNINLNLFLENYAIEDYGQQIQAYYDQKFPGIYKIFAFKSTGHLKPFWKSNCNNWKIPVVVYYHEEEEHFDGVGNTGHLFGTVDVKGHLRGQYCFGCEVPYQKPSEHSATCVFKCNNCQRVDKPDKGPCRADGFYASCLGCFKTFQNRECYDHHLKVKTTRTKNGIIKTNVCQRSKKCPDCKVIYSVRHNTYNGRDGHKCGEKFCRNCRQFHPDQHCFMTSDAKSEKKDLRFVFFDFEASTQFKPDPEVMKFLHEVNFVSVYVTCTRCIADGKWDKPLEMPCEICGPRRNYAFAPPTFAPEFGFEGPEEIEKIITFESPISAFTQWLLHFEEEMEKEMRGEEDVFREMGIIDGGSEEEEDLDDDDDDDGEEAGEYGEGRPAKKKKLRKCNFETVAYAHCGSRYDNIMIFGEIMRMGGLVPNLIRQGNRLYEMKVKKPGHITTTTFRDSYNLIPIRLANFVKTFGLDIETKQHFPHAFNVAENFENALDHLPDKHFYGPDSMMPSEREEFELWWEENKDEPFSLKEILADYCNNDVKILVHGMLKMRELFRDKTGLDITRYVTIASACMAFFKTRLSKGELALTPHMGYESHDKQSTIATKFLKWLAHLNKVNVQHVENGGEKEYKQYKLDGFIERPGQRNLAIEIQGCYYHACLRHYPDDNQQLVGGKTAGKLREYAARKRAEIEKEMDYKEYWTCEIEEMLEKSKREQRRLEREETKRRRLEEQEAELLDGRIAVEEPEIAEDNLMPEEEPEEMDGSLWSDLEYSEMGDASEEPIDPGMAKFFEECKVDGPIKISDAFFGGRTGPEYLFSTIIGNPEKVIVYRDVNSLYPKTNFYERYPIKHPRVQVYDKVVDWRKPEDVITEIEGKTTPLEGMIKCDIIPPRHPKHDFPVLPMRIGDRLHFSLCSACSNNFKKGGTKMDGYSCPHYEDKDRAFTITLPHIEINKALEAGYRITHLHRAYEWLWTDDWSNNIFHQYIGKFLKTKYEASGWPALCLDETVPEADRAQMKKDFLEEVWLMYGIRIKPEDMKPNPGLRYLAKLCLNSLWGRFALRNRLAQTTIVDTNEGLSKLLNDSRLDITDFEQLTPSATMIVHKLKDEHVVENSSSNPIIALWTTSSARLHLLDGIYRVLGGKGRVLYMDTDSLIYEYLRALGDPLEELGGDHLGDWKIEYPEYDIIEYVCAGSKAYALWLRHKVTGEIKYVIRCRGITLDCRTSEKLTYEKFKEHCLKFGTADNFTELEKKEKNFIRDKRGEIYTFHTSKKFEPRVSKGHVNDEFKVLPFGYSDPLICARDNPYPCSCKN